MGFASGAVREAPPDVAVLGLGNVLMGDDAVGPHVVARLRAALRFPPDVAVLDLGTPGLDLTPYLAGVRAVIVVDAVRGEQPGTIRVLRTPEILAWTRQPRLSPHEGGLLDCLLALQLAGNAPQEVVVVGIVPAVVETRIGLSPAVREALPAAVDAVLRELERLGIRGERRRQPDEPDTWWERAAGPASAAL